MITIAMVAAVALIHFSWVDFRFRVAGALHGPDRLGDGAALVSVCPERRGGSDRDGFGEGQEL
jgi:hypothetical protein